MLWGGRWVVALRVRAGPGLWAQWELAYLRGCTSKSGGCSSASSMAVMPRDQMSHSSLYPPFRATAATSGAILGAETLREPGVTHGKGGDSLAWGWEKTETEGEWGVEETRGREKHQGEETDRNRGTKKSRQNDQNKNQYKEGHLGGAWVA